MGRKRVASSTIVENQDAEEKRVPSQELQEYISHQIIASEMSIKTFMEAYIKINANTIMKQISDCVDEKYKIIHQRINDKQDEVLSREDVLIVVESVITEINIKENIKKYMNELTDLRLIILVKYYNSLIGL